MQLQNILDNRIELPISVRRAWLGFFLIAYLCLAIPSILTNSATFDESVHVSVGYVQSRYGLFYLDSSNPPLIRMIFGYPIRYYSPVLYWEDRLSNISDFSYAYLFEENNLSLYHTMIMTSRLLVLLISIFLAYLVYRWTREEYGGLAGLFSLLLFTFNPNILAHGTVATLDLGLTLSWVLVLYSLKKYMDKPSWFRVILTGLLLGLAQSSKFTSLLLFLIIPLILLLDKNYQKILSPYHFILHSLVALVVCVLVINSVYGFRGSFTSMNQFTFHFPAFQMLSSKIPLGTPVPFPYYYISGLDRQLTETAQYPIYLNGRFSDTGFGSYYLEAFVIKNPVAFLIFIGWAFYLLLQSFRKKKNRLSRSELIWIITAVVLIFFFSYSRMKNIGLRYILPAFPFLFMLCGRIISSSLTRKQIVVLNCLLIWLIGSTLYICPQYLAYYNELIGGPSNGYKYLLDSNTDWGQDFIRLKEYMTQHQLEKIWFTPSGPVDPKAYGIDFKEIPKEPVSGIVALSVDVDPYRGFPGPDPTKRERYHWLNQYPPIARVGYSIFVYNVPP